MDCVPDQAWRDCNVFVTGASGIVGSNLVRALLDRGARVHVLLRPSSSLWRLEDCHQRLVVHRGELADQVQLHAALAAARPERILHLATERGTGADRASAYLAASVLGAAHLIAWLRQHPATHLVVTGSSCEYAPADGPIREDHPLLPDTWHGAVKASARLLFRQAAQVDGLAITQLRLFHVYGPWESGHRFLPTALRLAMAGRPIPLVAGLSRRDWIHVDEVVAALLLAGARATAAGILNVGTGVEHTNAEVIQVLESVLGRPIAVRVDALPPRPTDRPHRSAQIAAAAAALGWVPGLSLEEGIRVTLAWLNGHPTVWGRESGPVPVVR